MQTCKVQVCAKVCLWGHYVNLQVQYLPQIQLQRELSITVVRLDIGININLHFREEHVLGEIHYLYEPDVYTAFLTTLYI